MSTDTRPSLGRHIDRVSVDISAECRSPYRPIVSTDTRSTDALSTHDPNTLSLTEELFIEVSWIQPLSVSDYALDTLHLSSLQRRATYMSSDPKHSQIKLRGLLKAKGKDEFILSLSGTWSGKTEISIHSLYANVEREKSNFCLLFLSDFCNEVKLFAFSWIHVDVFCLFLREEGAKSELHFAVRVCRKHGSKSVYCWSSQLL